MSISSEDIKENSTAESEQPTENSVTRAEQAHQTVKQYTLSSIVVGAIPVPLLDITALIGIQLKMLYDLAKQYEIPFSHNLAQSLLSSLLGSVIPTTAAPLVASIVKIIPGFGQASGAISMAMMGSAGTYAVGKIFIEHFESGGTLLDFNPEEMRKRFEELYEEGKQFVIRKTKK